MENITLTAKAVRFKTFYRRNSAGEITSTTRIVKMVGEDGTKFDATINNPDPLFKLGRGKPAQFEFDLDPRSSIFNGEAEILGIRTS